MPPSVSRKLARFATGLRFEDLPPNVVDKVKALTLQGTVSALAGHKRPGSRALLDLVTEEEGRGDAGGSRILVDGSRVTKGGAAFATAELIHRGGRLDIYRLLTHPGTSILPAGFVAAEAAASSGREFITAIAAGYEVQARIAGDWIPSTQARGFRSSPIFGIFGATVAAGRLASLTEDEMTTAIALAVELACGNLEGARTGSNSFSIHEAVAARNAMLAVRLARSWIHGSETALEGSAGFYHAFTGNNTGGLSFAFGTTARATTSTITAALGRRWEILDTALRIYDVAGYNAPLIEIGARLCARDDIRPDNISRVDVTVNWMETMYPSPAFPSARSKTPTIGGAEYYCALGILQRGYPLATERTPSTAVGSGPAGLTDLMERIRIGASRNRPLLAPRMTIRTLDGAAHVLAFTGRELMFDFAQELDRIREIVPALPVDAARFDAIASAIRDLESLERLTDLTDLTIVSDAATTTPTATTPTATTRGS